MWMAFSDALLVPRPQALCSTPPTVSKSASQQLSAPTPSNPRRLPCAAHGDRAHLAFSGTESTEGPLEWPGLEASAAAPPAVEGLEDGLLAEAVLRSSGIQP